MAAVKILQIRTEQAAALILNKLAACDLSSAQLEEVLHVMAGPLFYFKLVDLTPVDQIDAAIDAVMNGSKL